MLKPPKPASQSQSSPQNDKEELIQALKDPGSPIKPLVRSAAALLILLSGNVGTDVDTAYSVADKFMAQLEDDLNSV